ncbi:pentatricopeptide repeat-containing protein At4g02750-like [Andrographis paniculata]|uniref:pentatricopeptide repeat-containing protein At4g02750-like n=1 Tax=Andrographis paniculata TaxID=175694 RepID=UPI0021E947CF|nr:pentatricopeptide repeat-containing protein At4g02750-like [Andrographis paniculata]XP_051130983.1 pentatricopeptide repeat-containing protein At4g02750-like [Andrographis paniculata]
MIHGRKWLSLISFKWTIAFGTGKPLCSCGVHTGHPWKPRKNQKVVALTQKILQLSHRGNIANARRMFDQMLVRDSVTWNVMIGCFLENGMIQHAREVFDEMPEKTSVSWNTMIMGYINLGKTHIAQKIFVVMPDKDVVSWTAMITGLCRASQVDDAWCLFKRMPDANEVSWSSIVSGFQQNGFAKESLKVFKEMLVAGVRPTAHVFTSTLSACADLAAVSTSEQIYSQVLKRGFHGNNHVGNSAISMFVKCGCFHHAKRAFRELNEPDLVTWNAMIVGFAQHGFGIEAMMIFHQMQKAQVLPDSISYMGVLHGCSHCGYVEDGKKYFQSMETDHGISPVAEHFAAMVDLYARAGHLSEAYEFILKQTFEPTAVLWRSLLSGCRIWGATEMGVFAAEQILRIEPNNSSACLMIIDIFSMAGKWKEVAKMRQYMRDTQTRKELGHSWIDVKGRNYLFTTGDDIHPEMDQISAMVDLLAYGMSKQYVMPKGLPD